MNREVVERLLKEGFKKDIAGILAIETGDMLILAKEKDIIDISDYSVIVKDHELNEGVIIPHKNIESIDPLGSRMDLLLGMELGLI